MSLSVHLGVWGCPHPSLRRLICLAHANRSDIIWSWYKINKGALQLKWLESYPRVYNYSLKMRVDVVKDGAVTYENRPSNLSKTYIPCNRLFPASSFLYIPPTPSIQRPKDLSLFMRALFHLSLIYRKTQSPLLLDYFIFFILLDHLYVYPRTGLQIKI